MTACVNKKSKRVAAVVTASLVGALSIGAPAVALADTTVDMLVAPEENAFSRGKVTLTGATESDGVWEAQANKDGSALDIKATKVLPLGGREVSVNNDDYKLSFAKADGTAVDSIVEPGQYIVTVECLKGQYAGGKATAKLAVKAATLDKVTACEDVAAGDLTFVYSGKKLNVEFADLGGNKLDEGEDYTIKILKEGTDNVPSAASVDVLEAGNYVGYMTGMGQYAGETAEVHFTVKAFDFGTANVVVDDVIASESAPKHPTKVTNGVEGAADYVELDPSLVSLEFSYADNSDSQLFDKPGAYNFKASVDPLNSSISGADSKFVNVNKVAAYADFKYGDAALEDTYSVNLDKGQSFDLDKVKAYNGKNEAKGVTVSAVRGGTVVKSGELTEGTWTVTVSVDPSANEYAVGGSKTFTVKVALASVDADANVFVYYKNEAVTSVEKTYDNKAIVKSDFVVKAFKDDNTDVSSKVSFNIYDESGKKVDKIVDAGTYTLKIETDELELSGTTEIAITIDKVDLSKLYVMQAEKWPEHKDGASYVAKTSAKLGFDKILGYNTGVKVSDGTDGASDDEGIDEIGCDVAGKNFTPQCKAERFDVKKKEWVKVPYPDIFTVEGQYRFTLTGTSDDAKNFTFANADNTTVVEVVCVDAGKLVFNDVKPGDWFFDVVFEAQASGWMNGYADGVLFGAHDQITRGQVACVLFNMAGADMNETDASYNEVFGWKSFDDVNGKAYYGEAIAWAKQAGVVNGYGDGTFAPDAPVTREELACMLANYAKKVDQADVSIEDADKVLSSMSDGSAVSDWAKGSVAWAVENGIMGNVGFVNAFNDITRAETAAMVVNYKA